MFDKLKKINQKYLDLQKLILLEENSKKKVQLFKEIGNLKVIIDTYNEYLNLEKELFKIKHFIKNNSNNNDLLELAFQEQKILNEKIQNEIKKLKYSLFPLEPEDNKNVIMQIKGAAGGDEANLFSADLFRMYCKYAELKNWKIEILNLMTNIKGGISSVEFILSGKKVYYFLKYESGVHRVQRVPNTEVQGRIHTSTSTVLVMPEVDEIDFKIDWKDIRFDTFNSSGPGGQSVNTTKSAVRLTHLPTNISVACQIGKSQHENKKKAFSLLKARIYDKINKKNTEKENKKRKFLIGGGERSEKIRTYNYPQNRITDHRISLNLKKLDIIMEGKLDFIIEPLINEYKK
ncbi:MAG: peptide chain release factor 1 [Candidatus Phytoplasma pyri]|uniref:peptide chain release factor 1 n=1 Tax=Candidatus Phytoplasma pyri TaxID=47566 RepID=UPI0039839AFB